MPLNPYFMHGTNSEQKLLQSLVNEQIDMFGLDIIYMPRKFITEKQIIKELLVSKFDEGFHLEAYLKTTDGFGGQGDILSKFGIRSTDEITLVISKERFETFILPFITNEDNIKLTTRPQEGDLIYFPLDNALFEIKFVEPKSPFYQLNNLYVFEFKCELFEYEDEIIDTGIIEVDETIKDFGYTTTLRMMDSTAASATAAVQLAAIQYSIPSGKSVSYVDILNGGYGYKSTPTITIQKPTVGERATAVAIMTSKNFESTIDKILIINPGIGYTIPPKISIASTSGSGFIATTIISTGIPGPISIGNSGNQYSTAPSVGVTSSPTGNNAQIVAVRNSSGQISQLRYINAGSGYTASPAITIAPPDSISEGNYIYNEIIRGVSSGTSAYVKDWNYTSRILKVGILNGNFAIGEIISGSEANYNLYSVDAFDVDDAFASNEEIQTESDTILDFTESNPFGIF